jgi:hypothetical protein
MTKLLMPDVDTRMSQKELTHVETVNSSFNKAVLDVLDDETEKDRTKIVIAKILLKSNKDAQDISPSATENILQQLVRSQGQGVLDGQLDAVAGWSTKLITEVAGGGVAGLGGIGLLVNMLMRKSKALRVVNSELSDDAKAKVKKALQHTGLEKEVT